MNEGRVQIVDEDRLAFCGTVPGDAMIAAGAFDVAIQQGNFSYNEALAPGPED